MLSFSAQRLARPSRIQHLSQPWRQESHAQFPLCQFSGHQCRHASISSAINGGKKRAHSPWQVRGHVKKSLDKGAAKDSDKGHTEQKIYWRVHKKPDDDGGAASAGERPPQHALVPEPPNQKPQFVDWDVDRRSNSQPPEQKEFSYRDHYRKKRSDRLVENRDHLIRRSTKPPFTIPYASPESEFVYGTSAVLAALKCRRRKLNILYIYDSTSLDDVMHLKNNGGNVRSDINVVRKFALLANVQIKEVAGRWLPFLDRMCKGRPHNGLVLDASPLPQAPLRSLKRVSDPTQTHFHVSMAHQTQEEQRVNGATPEIPRFSYSHPQERSMHEAVDARPQYPFIIMLQNVTDSGNVGAIIRSAYYFGADAVILSRGCAPLSPHTMKASSGAAENLPLMSVSNPTDFIAKSQKDGWKFFAADTPSPPSKDENNAYDKGHSSKPKKPQPPRRNAKRKPSPLIALSQLRDQLHKAPCVLVMGSEATGLGWKLLRDVDARVSIEGAVTRSLVEDAASVDSLNVSVATALLCNAFLGDKIAPDAMVTNPGTGNERIF